MDNNSEQFDCRLALILPAYDPYKDAFDIFMDLFEKNWPDCPYPFVVANMHFECNYPNIRGFIHLPCGDERSFRNRKERALARVKAKYYLVLEEDRMFGDRVSTADIEEILDFMDQNDIRYYRLNPSFFRKKNKDSYNNCEHHFYIPAKEPYGLSGATSIFREDYEKELNQRYSDGYQVENGFLEDSFNSHTRTLPQMATDDRNVLHIIHCIDKSQWIPRSKRKLRILGYDLSNSSLQTQSVKTAVISELKASIGKLTPIKYRYRIKKLLGFLGMEFSTKY